MFNRLWYMLRTQPLKPDSVSFVILGRLLTALCCMQCFVISKLFSIKIEEEVIELGVGRSGVLGREESLLNHCNHTALLNESHCVDSR